MEKFKKFDIGQSAAKSRIEKGSTTIAGGQVGIK